MNDNASAAMNPYIGPVPFEREHKNLFFGRQREIKQLMYLLVAERVVLLHSPSGAGKTSLIQAGLIPTLEEQKKRFQVLPVMQVGKVPDPAMLEGIPDHNRYVLSALMSLEEEISKDNVTPLSELAGTTFDLYLAEQWQHDEDKPNQVLIFDQFEELLTADPTDQETKAEFFRQVGAALRDPRRWALFSMREDYLAGLDPYLLPVPGRLETRFRLDLLAEEAALAAIQKPASTVGVTFTDDAAGRLRKELSKVRVQALDGTSEWAAGPYAEPILLQVVCQHLWALKGPQAMEITLKLVESIGDVDEALWDYYARQVGTIATETAVNEWDVRDWFEDQLITPQGVRSQVLHSPDQSGGLDNDTIGRLVRAHLVRPERRRGLTWYELAHDRLIEPVRQNNAEWRVRSLEGLSRRYGKLVPEIAYDLGVPEWRIRGWIDQELVTEQGTRRLARETEIEREGLQDAVDRLVELEFIRRERRPGETWYELAHDRLIEPIQKSNDRWREKNLSPFYPRAVRWEVQNRPGDMLLTEGELPEMEHWVKVNPDRVTPEETAFLKASRRERTRVNLADLGWGVIFAFEDQERVPELREALHELLELRAEQAGDRYREFTGLDAYRPEETAEGFLARQGVGPATVNPDRVPYYLLIVGDPETIPWEFQYALDMHHAVGRIQFDRPEEYTRYARSVAVAERGQVILAPRTVFFGVRNPGDEATQLSANHLVGPLAAEMAEEWPAWQVETALAGDATKAELARLLGGDRTPALLFTASQALGVQPDGPLPSAHMGALVCGEWPGPRAWRGGPLPPDFYFAADDVGDDARLLGLVAFLWGSYTAGTPRLDDFAHLTGKEPEPIAPLAFVARLPQRLLAHPLGGALAVIGHVSNVFMSSFTIGSFLPPLENFRQTFQRLVNGHTVGSALEPFNQRYASLASSLAVELQQLVFHRRDIDYNPDLVARMTTMIDARNYVILGDPAVRLPVAIEAPAAERPTIEPVEVAAEPPSVELRPEAAVEAPLRATELVVFNGINAATGQYLQPSMPPKQVAQVAMGEALDEEMVRELKLSYERISGQPPEVDF